VAEIEKKFKAESAEWYQKLSEADEERQKLQKHLSEYADALARIDQSELDNQMQEVLQLYYNGEVSKAIRILDNMRLSESLIHTLNQKHILEQDSAHQVEAIRSSIILYKNSGEWDKAAQLLKLLADQVNTPKEISSYALFCHQQNKFEEAIKYFQRELEMEQHLAKENQHLYEPHIAVALRNLGSLYHNLERYAEAEKIYREALVIRRRLAGVNPQHEPALAMSLNNLAGLYRDTHRLEEAEKMYQEALSIRRGLAERNPQTYTRNVAKTLKDMSKLYIYMKDFKKAEKHVREALSLNPAEPSYVENLIAALLFQGKSAEAENLCRKYKEEVKDDMLEDLQLFAEEGIIPKKCEADVEKIKKILNEQ
jgi:tetratricopeptide (TPR) repeat protein